MIFLTVVFDGRDTTIASRTGPPLEVMHASPSAQSGASNGQLELLQSTLCPPLIREAFLDFALR
jgi:hypothetical protein